MYHTVNKKALKDIKAAPMVCGKLKVVIERQGDLLCLRKIID